MMLVLRDFHLTLLILNNKNDKLLSLLAWGENGWGDFGNSVDKHTVTELSTA